MRSIGLFLVVFLFLNFSSGIRLLDNDSGHRKCHAIDMIVAGKPNKTVECHKSCSVVWDSKKPVFSLCDFSYAPQEGCEYLKEEDLCICFCNTDLCNTFDYPHTTCWPK